VGGSGVFPPREVVAIKMHHLIWQHATWGLPAEGSFQGMQKVCVPAAGTVSNVQRAVPHLYGESICLILFFISRR
jgi:hypothetical protein